LPRPAVLDAALPRAQQASAERVTSWRCAAGVGEDDGQRPADLTDNGTPAARSCLLVPFPLRGLPEEELADSRLFGDYHRTLFHAAALSEKVG
jgi:hypothetical protein